MKNLLTLAAFLLTISQSFVFGQELEEFKIKRKEVFEFTSKPKIEKSGDLYQILFTVKDYCDATVVIEDSSGRILRHLISGVLGSNPPKGFLANTLEQKVAWDGKDDEGKYIDSLKDCHVRVSLGLRPVYEKRLYSTPYKRIANNAPLLAIDESGVYTFEGLGFEYIKQFNHIGEYLKTVYPFPANKIKNVKGLKYFTSLKDGKSYPQKLGYNQATHLTSGTSSGGDANNHTGGYAATAMAVNKGKIALAYKNVNRISVDGSEVDLNGPEIGITIPWLNQQLIVGPTSIALSPDNKYLYATGYVYKTGFFENAGDCFHVVYKMEYAKNEPPIIFKGKRDKDKGIGNDNESFCVPSSVAVDVKGRVYISDFGNDRIQVYEEGGKFLKSIAVKKPAKVLIDPKTQEIYSFSWKIIGPSFFVQKEKNINIDKINSSMSQLGTFENPKESKPESLPISNGNAAGGRDTGGGGQVYEVALSFYGKNQTIWVSSKKPTGSLEEFAWGSGDGVKNSITSGWANNGVKAFEKVNGKWVNTVDFGKKAAEEVKQTRPPSMGNQRLHFNPSDGCLYIAEDLGFNKSSDELVKINPETSEITIVPIPFDAAEDIVFGYHDIAYLRTHYVVVRYNSKNWKEIPWDYGNEFDKIFFQTFYALPRGSASAVSGLPIPGIKPVHWQLGGMNINAKGHLAVVCYLKPPIARGGVKDRGASIDKYKYSYKPFQYPGRSGHYIINIYDKYGKILKEDALPGLPDADGLGIDSNDDLYVLLRSKRYVNEKHSFLEYTETLMKSTPGKSKIIGNGLSEIPVPNSDIPKRNVDIIAHGFSAWIENVEWLYGGVGHGGQAGCACWHGGFGFDLLGRSFVSEANQYQVAVLDSSGNLILRCGQYSNADSYGAKSPVPLGGDEIGIMAAHYVGVETDKRLFIADTGNQRILSVKLNYEVNVSLPIPQK